MSLQSPVFQHTNQSPPMLKHVLRSLLLIAFPSTAGGWRSGVEEHPEQLAAHSPAVYLLLVALALVPDFRPLWLTCRLPPTHRHHELVSCYSPNLIEEGSEAKPRPSNPQAYRQERREEILRAYEERSSLRGPEWTFGASRHTMIGWVKKAEKLPALSETLIEPDATDAEAPCWN
jgi:hypothetical protein